LSSGPKKAKLRRDAPRTHLSASDRAQEGAPAPTTRGRRSSFLGCAPRYWARISRRGHPGRPRIDAEIRPLIRTTAQDGWGAPRIHAELTKLGFVISEIKVSRYLPRLPAEHGRRHILHFNATFHPAAAWIIQQLRQACPYVTFPATSAAPRFLTSPATESATRVIPSPSRRRRPHFSRHNCSHCGRPETNYFSEAI